ncbi:uncharacterized protein ARMOST_17467 [Armillaria ostoyae]|uniref:Uncharacterized protein n=1 Tax=Armillaria ostoyae TaxID=47428 RepID=A0A284RZ25_ARMOS|nr:uncharacterized protein ARMOST_17467 [Armillaria ostoyae]
MQSQSSPASSFFCQRTFGFSWAFEIRPDGPTALPLVNLMAADHQYCSMLFVAIGFSFSPRSQVFLVVVS